MNKETEEMRIDVRNALTFALMDEKLQYIPDFDKPITEYLQKQGYGKVEDHKKQSVWHKVADGDLPKKEGQYYVVIRVASYTFYKVLWFSENEFTMYDNEYGEFIPVKEVVAWTKLPEYEE